MPSSQLKTIKDASKKIDSSNRRPTTNLNVHSQQGDNRLGSLDNLDSDELELGEV